MHVHALVLAESFTPLTYSYCEQQHSIVLAFPADTFERV